MVLEHSQQIQEDLTQSIIQSFKSPCNFPILIVLKKVGKHRLAIDYRKINNHWGQIDDVIGQLGNSGTTGVLTH